VRATISVRLLPLPRTTAHLFLQLLHNDLVRTIGVLARSDSHRCILEHRNAPREICDVSSGKFSLPRNAIGEFPGIVLHILDMRFDLETKFL
jgi:hypothetical protein